MFHVGDVIRKLRLQQELSVEALANRAGINKMTLSAVERGETNYKRQTLEAIARALNTDVDHIFLALRPGTNGQKTVSSQSPDMLTDAEREHLRRWRLLSERARDSIEIIMRDLLPADAFTEEPSRHQ